MPYLTYEEYKDFGFAELEESEFNRLLPKASDVVDGVTRHFYKFNNLDDDVPFRKEQFKKAVGAQIEYFHELGATTFEGVNKAPQTFQVGRTSVSNTSRYNPSGKNESKSLVAEEVYMYLEGTGLLYKGIGVRT
jgi:hypothetical protein